MSFLSRLLGTEPDPREELRALWHRTVEIAREPEWYEAGGAADTLDGRFDMVTAVTALVLLRMEAKPELAPKTAFLTEFFVEDMDGQLRQSGVGDLMVGKKIGKLMSTLGGRIGAYRKGLAEGRDVLADAVRRNIELTDETKATQMAERLEALRDRLAATSADALLAGDIA